MTKGYTLGWDHCVQSSWTCIVFIDAYITSINVIFHLQTHEVWMWIYVAFSWTMIYECPPKTGSKSVWVSVDVGRYARQAPVCVQARLSTRDEAEEGRSWATPEILFRAGFSVDLGENPYCNAFFCHAVSGPHSIKRTGLLHPAPLHSDPTSNRIITPTAFYR